jgi:hypothetical protein
MTPVESFIRECRKPARGPGRGPRDRLGVGGEDPRGRAAHLPRPVETDSGRRRRARRFPRSSALVSAVSRREAVGSSSVPCLSHDPGLRRSMIIGRPIIAKHSIRPPWLCDARIPHPWQGADRRHAAPLPHASGKSGLSTPRMRARRSGTDRCHTGRRNRPKGAVHDGRHRGRRQRTSAPRVRTCAPRFAYPIGQIGEGRRLTTARSRAAEACARCRRP